MEYYTAVCAHSPVCVTDKECRTKVATHHALAVLGARVLAAFIDGDDELESDPLAFVQDAAVDLIGCVSEGNDHYTYATPQIAATVAALTQTGGSDAR